MDPTVRGAHPILLFSLSNNQLSLVTLFVGAIHESPARLNEVQLPLVLLSFRPSWRNLVPNPPLIIHHFAKKQNFITQLFHSRPYENFIRASGFHWAQAHRLRTGRIGNNNSQSPLPQSTFVDSPL